jgi:hypothetical protein
MRLQRKPERWMCLPTSFAIALDMPVATVLAEIGHDGGKLANPLLPEPLCRAGFHIQELIDVCLRHGLAVTPIELCPVLSPGPKYEPHEVFTDEAGWQRFARAISTSRGVIEGIGRRSFHAVAYDHGRIYDPDAGEYDYSPPNCEARSFIPFCAWRIDPIGERTCE